MGKEKKNIKNPPKNILFYKLLFFKQKRMGKNTTF